MMKSLPIPCALVNLIRSAYSSPSDLGGVVGRARVHPGEDGLQFLARLEVRGAALRRDQRLTGPRIAGPPRAGEDAG